VTLDGAAQALPVADGWGAGERSARLHAAVGVGVSLCVIFTPTAVIGHAEP
jgi:hypothetical protein